MRLTQPWDLRLSLFAGQGILKADSLDDGFRFACTLVVPVVGRTLADATFASTNTGGCKRIFHRSDKPNRLVYHVAVRYNHTQNLIGQGS